MNVEERPVRRLVYEIIQEYYKSNGLPIRDMYTFKSKLRVGFEIGIRIEVVYNNIDTIDCIDDILEKEYPELMI